MSFISPHRLAAFAAATLTFSLSAFQANAATPPQGVWIDSNGRGAVEIKPCGDALCGHVVWVKNTADAKGCGRQIIGDAAPSGGGAHEGWIYSPEDRKRYNVEISPTKDGRLKVVGYAGMRLFSKTMYWTPASSDLVRCDSVEAKVTPKAPEPVAAATSRAPAPASVTAALPAPVPSASQPAAAPRSAVPAPVPALPPKATAKSTNPAAIEVPAKASASAPAPANANPSADAQPSTSTQSAVAAPEGEDGDPATAEMAEKPGLKKLAKVLDKVLTRSRNGDCNLDLPWLQVRFRCDDE